VSKPRRVPCPDCKTEGHSEPGIIGELVELRGRLAWHGFDPASAREVARFPLLDNGGEPPQARHVWVADIASATEVLRGWCRRHGAVSVSPACRQQMS